MAVRDPIRDPFFEASLFRSRAVIAGVICLSLVLALLARLYYLQGVGYRHYATLSTNNRVRLMAIAPTRGLIYDRNGVVLAENLPRYRLEITPESVSDLDATFRELREIVDFDQAHVDRFRKALRGRRPFEGIALLNNLSDDEVARVAANRHRFPGVDIAARLQRYYPLGDLMAHQLGYVGRIDERELKRLDPTDYGASSYVGKTGIEKHYERRLHGSAGFRQVEVNAEGRVLRVLEERAPRSGEDLYLTVDVRLQSAAVAALGDESGAVVAMDPVNGDILAMVSRPAFDPNLFVTGIGSAAYRRLRDDDERPLFNRALSGQYPPGSIVKPFLGLAALETGLLHANKVHFCPGYYMLPNDDHRYRDWKKHGHGAVNLGQAIARSCDVYFYELALHLGIDRISPWLQDFGFGGRTGIDNIGEASGLLPSRGWKKRARGQRWFPGETLITGIGQGYLTATPLQLASATATFSTAGRRVRPRMLASIGKPPASPEERSGEVVKRVPIAQQKHWDSIQRAMLDVAHHWRGTAFGANEGVAYRVAGKTGTAQVVAIAQDEEYDEDSLARKLRDHAVYVAFAPVPDPRVVVAVLVEHGGSGGSVAAPIARRILDDYLMRGHTIAVAMTNEGPQH